MKKFRFARIKRIREVEEKLAEEAFAEAAAKVRELAEKSKEYTVVYRQYRNRFQRGEIDWVELANLIKRIEKAKKDLIEAYNNLQEKRQELLQANVRLKMMEKLEEMWREKVFFEELQSLQEILDDFASYKSYIGKS
jgi:flagellar export protein FliJ